MLRLFVLAAVLCAPSLARAEWKITNKDANSYSIDKNCSGKQEDWSIAGGVTKTLSIPAGAPQCTLTLNATSCSVRDGEACVVQSGKISKQ
ncbi:MAG: hypothetical protein EXR71_20880 [Myxococcales bacterium]|nr:hypothetical protein [Myxococcales bacterium]